MKTMDNSQTKSLAPMEGTGNFLDKALKKSTQFLREYFTEHDLSKVTDLPATIKHVENVIGMFQLDKYDYPEDIMEHIEGLCAACEEMETFVRNPLELKVSSWAHTPIYELIPEEAEIRKAWNERMDALGLDPMTIQFSDDAIVWQLTDLLQEIGIAKDEMRAELKGCETPEWYDEPDWITSPDWDEEYEEEESIIKEHLAEVTPSDEWIAEQDAITEMEVMGKTAVEGIALREAAYNNL